MIDFEFMLAKKRRASSITYKFRIIKQNGGYFMKNSKFASLFLSSSLLIGILAGCGADEGSSSEGGDTIKIGANLELSGATASYGTSEADAIEVTGVLQSTGPTGAVVSPALLGLACISTILG